MPQARVAIGKDNKLAARRGLGVGARVCPQRDLDREEAHRGAYICPYIYIYVYAKQMYKHMSMQLGAPFRPAA